jgi:tRNA-specific 2-thiouridylase
MEKVYVGMSGGVDSSVSAALLQRQGYDVTGVFIKIWQPEFIECTWREDRLDAMRVCAALSIPFLEIDLSEEYKTQVVETMVADYMRGLTPNPDVLCNEKIKFGVFMRWALDQGAEYVATGHYAQIRECNGKKVLARAVDNAKDQSYFLYRINGIDLERVLFPIGSIEKSDVRKTAKRFNLPIAEKADSQGLCFVGDVSMRDFLRRYIQIEEGTVVDTHGIAIGTHDGTALYTIGQRHGFTVDKNPGGNAYFVTGIDTHSNILIVSHNKTDTMRLKTKIRDVHWISTPPHLHEKYLAQTRYHETPVSATIRSIGDTTEIIFDTPHTASPGQSLVLYDDDACMGGGIICVQ